MDRWMNQYVSFAEISKTLSIADDSNEEAVVEEIRRRRRRRLSRLQS